MASCSKSFVRGVIAGMMMSISEPKCPVSQSVEAILILRFVFHIRRVWLGSTDRDVPHEDRVSSVFVVQICEDSQ
jgi:hypothetical protein